MSPDEALSEYIIGKFTRYHFKPALHGRIEDVKVVTCDAAWECGCLSEYTRDDSINLIAHIRTALGVQRFEYGTWGGLPEIIASMVDIMAGDNDCRYEED